MPRQSKRGGGRAHGSPHQRRPSSPRQASPPPKQKQRASTPPPRSNASPSSPPSDGAAPSAPLPFCRHTKWSDFDKAFTAFEANLSNVPSGLAAVRLADIPFPPANDPAGIGESGLVRGKGTSDAGSNGKSSRKVLLRKALLRWHPDKWAGVMSKVRPEDKGRLGEELAAITQALLAEKDRM